MKRKKHLWYRVIAVLAIGIGGALGAETVDTFSGLPASDSLRVRFVSNGCFHSANYEFVFSGSSPRSVSVFALAGQRAAAKNSVLREDLGQVGLTDSDLKGLDALLRFYRSGATGGCTTVDSIEISQVSGDKTVRTERFSDHSCRTYEMQELTTFPEIVRRAQAKRNAAGS